jgi:hypothetical protein
LGTVIEQITYAVALVLMVLCVLRFFKAVRGYSNQQVHTRILRVTCRKCGNTFEGTQDSLKMGIMHKEVSTTRTKLKDGAMVNVPEYKSYARKVFCPYCQSMEWADIHDVNEIGQENRQAVRPHLIRLVVYLLAINFVAALITKLAGPLG